MNKTIFTLIFAVIFSSMVHTAEASVNRGFSSVLITAMESSGTGIDRKKKRKLKKKVRQAGRIYKLVKTDKKDKKKARKTQRKIRRIINII